MITVPPELPPPPELDDDDDDDELPLELPELVEPPPRPCPPPPFPSPLTANDSANNSTGAIWALAVLRDVDEAMIID